MLQLPDPRAEKRKGADYRPKQPDVILLNGKQWLYVQNRYNLTPRERQIAELICQGLRNGSIARSLRIKTGTVKTHTRNIYRKVRVESKIGMLLRFVTDARDLSPAYDGVQPAPVGD
jgi:DNA-binding NarL/FixJ family response regulator